MGKYASGLDMVFLALAHPARRAMLARLGQGEATVGELAGPLGISLPAVTKHLKVMERAKLISRSRAAQWRPCRLEAGPLTAASGWIDEQLRVWEAWFTPLETCVRALEGEEGRRDGR